MSHTDTHTGSHTHTHIRTYRLELDGIKTTEMAIVNIKKKYYRKERKGKARHGRKAGKENESLVRG